MFYEIKKGEVLIERMNPPADKNGKGLLGSAADEAVVARAKEIGADSVTASDGRKVVTVQGVQTSPPSASSAGQNHPEGSPSESSIPPERLRKVL